MAGTQTFAPRADSSLSMMLIGVLALSAVVSSLFMQGCTLQIAHEMTVLQAVGDRTARQFLAILASGLSGAAYGMLRGNITLILPNVVTACVAAYSLAVFRRFNGVFQKRDFVATSALGAIALFGLVLGSPMLVGTVATVPAALIALTPLVQALPVMERRSTVGVVVPPLVVQCVAVASGALWTVYGFAALGDAFICLPNLLAASAATLLLYATRKYGGRQAPMPPPMSAAALRGSYGEGNSGAAEARHSEAKEAALEAALGMDAALPGSSDSVEVAVRAAVDAQPPGFVALEVQLPAREGKLIDV